MPKYFCDYCDTYLTHDSPSVRKTHCAGRKHKENVKSYYEKWYEQNIQKVQRQRPQVPPPSSFANLDFPPPPMAAGLLNMPPPPMPTQANVMLPPPNMINPHTMPPMAIPPPPANLIHPPNLLPPPMQSLLQQPPGMTTTMVPPPTHLRRDR